MSVRSASYTRQSFICGGLAVKLLAVHYMSSYPTRLFGRSRIVLFALAMTALLAASCTDDGADEVDDGLLWTIDNAVNVGFEKGEELKPGPAKVLEAWSGTYKGARVELYRHGVTELGIERPADPTWLHSRIQADDCCNFWQRNRLTAICALEEQACKELRDALEEAFPL